MSEEQIRYNKMDIYYYWEVVMKRIKLIISLSLIFMVVTALVVFFQPKPPDIYKGEAILNTSPMTADELLNIFGNIDPAALKTILPKTGVSVLTMNFLSVKSADKLKIAVEANNPDINQIISELIAHLNNTFVTNNGHENNKEALAQEALNLKKKVLAKEVLNLKKKVLAKEAQEAIDLKKRTLAKEALNLKKKALAQEALNLKQRALAKEALNLKKKALAQEALNLKKEAIKRDKVLLEANIIKAKKMEETVYDMLVKNKSANIMINPLSSDQVIMEWERTLGGKALELKGLELKALENKELELKELENKELKLKELENKELEINKELELKALENKELELKALENKELELKALENKELELKELGNKKLENKELENKKEISLMDNVFESKITFKTDIKKKILLAGLTGLFSGVFLAFFLEFLEKVKRRRCLSE